MLSLKFKPEAFKPSRRQFLLGAAVAGAGLSVSFRVPGARAEAAAEPNPFNAYVTISPDNKVAGLKIDRLTIDRAGNPADNHFRYKLVLVQALKHEHTIYGRVRLEVNGAQGGRDAVLAFPTMNDKQHNVNFKYFQEFEGVMKLPRNFQPSMVKVSITTTSPAAQTLEQNHAWPKL